MLRKGSGRSPSRCYIVVALLEVHIAPLSPRRSGKEKNGKRSCCEQILAPQSASTQCGSQHVTQAGLGSLLVIDWSTLATPRRSTAAAEEAKPDDRTGARSSR